MPLQRSLAVWTASLSMCAVEARAGASLFVDDAAVTPAGRCQLEAWSRAYAPGRELTAVPACHWAGVEASLGVSRFIGPADGPVASLGIKRLFRDFDTHDWGIGASAGATWDDAHDRVDSWNVNVPASFALDAERRTVLHANVGWTQTRHAHGALTGGVGIERTLDERWLLLAEAYGDDRGGGGAQIGVRRAIRDTTSVDLLLGRQRGVTDAPWLTLGINVLLPN